jgi:hypothetical protein
LLCLVLIIYSLSFFLRGIFVRGCTYTHAHKEILKNSIDYDEKGQDRIFIMKDLVSVEDAIANGAEKVV